MNPADAAPEAMRLDLLRWPESGKDAAAKDALDDLDVSLPETG